MKPLYRNMFNFAHSLNSGYELLKSKYMESGDYIFPSILCSTFCVEILLKTLQAIKYDDVFTKDDLLGKGVKIDGHKYSEIYDSIENDIRKVIIGKYNEIYHEYINDKQFKAMLVLLGENNFIEWRYAYEINENKGINIELQDKILMTLGKSLETILKEKDSNLFN